MQYGFIIDNRKCIGCHACTVACKSEHDVAIGVNRTWVKQTEKGEFPNTRRVFSVLRCNHCSDAPCVEICPVQALYIRKDGIVDFNNDRCIGCKSCMQACPYDALYIDPDTHTAAKCNYCAHRIDIGLEPACVNVCPEHAIISGNVDDPESEIAQLLAREQVTVRKPEKSTKPNLYYINGDEASLTPFATPRSDEYIWGSQKTGVGHYAKFLEKLTEGKDAESLLAQLDTKDTSKEMTYSGTSKKSVEVLMEAAKARRVYDTPDKGILWGWEVSGYVLTKAIAAGVILIPFIALLTGGLELDAAWNYALGAIALFFLAATGGLLVKDLDQPKRFLYVLLRPQWKSWLTRGGYAITTFGGLVTLWLVAVYFDVITLTNIAFLASAVLAIVVAIYTAFLFAQAKGRDFWQSPTLVLHMLTHSIMAGAAAILIASQFLAATDGWIALNETLLAGSIAFNLLLMLVELTITHPTQDAKSVVSMIVSGRYKTMFWVGAILFGNIVPLVLLSRIISQPAIASVVVLVGIFITEKIWVEAPQRIPLT
jgi:Fe-S-cluster-containing dehydrogenase component/formate-dependent nitrite reductase membrane component NrfD